MVEVVGLVRDGRLLVLLVVVPDPVSREAQLVVQHGGRLGARHAALLQTTRQLRTVQAGLLLDGRAVAVHGDAAGRKETESATTLSMIEEKKSKST